MQWWQLHTAFGSVGLSGALAPGASGQTHCLPLGHVCIGCFLRVLVAPFLSWRLTLMPAGGL